MSFLILPRSGTALAQEGVPEETRALTLKECLDIASKNSKDISISFEKIALAELKERASFRDLFPSLSLSWNETKGEDSDIADYKGSQYGLEGEYELWPRDFISYSYLQSGKDLSFNQLNYQKVGKDLAYEVTKAFYELALAKKELKDQLDILKNANSLCVLAEKGKEAGLSSQLEYFKAISRYREIETGKETKGYALRLAGVKLREAIYLERGALIDIKEEGLFEMTNDKRPAFAGAPMTKQEEEESLSKHIATALSNRLEMEMQQDKADFYQYGEKAVRGKGKPKLSLVGSYKKVGDAYEPDKIDYEGEWFVGAKVAFPWLGSTMEYSYETGVSVPNRTSTYSTINESDVRNQSVKLSVLNNLPYYHERQEAEIAYQSALKEKEDQSRNIVMEVSQAFYEYRNAVHKTITAKERLKFTLKEYEVIEAKRQLGEEPVSGSLEALIRLQEAGTSYNQAIFEYELSILDLNKALGVE